MAARYKWAKYRITTSVDYNMSWSSDHDFAIYKHRESEVFGSSYTVTGEDSIRLNNTKTVKGADMDSSLEGWYMLATGEWVSRVEAVSNEIDATIWYTTGRVNNYVEVEERGSYIGDVTSTNVNEYPKDGVKNGYWYVYKGEINPPTVPASITIPETIRGGQDIKISWTASTDPNSNLDGYIVERSYDGGSSWSQIYQGRATSATTTIPFGTATVMFRVCAYDTDDAKSGWKTSGNKTVVNNRAPAAPPSISVPLKPAGGEKLTVTWTASTDADGNLEGYELERQWDGAGAFTQIYKGAGLSYQDSIPKGEHTNVVYRVRAYDSFASYSSYTTSPSRTIDNNTAPVIECDLSGDLGEKSEGFSIQYTIKDAEKQEVTVVERVGDLVKRTYKATLDEQATFEITGEYFQRILNGAQTVQIVATDSAGKSSTLQLTFTKAVHRAVITLSEPLAVEKQIAVAVLAITGKIPADATQLIELTNNGNDPEPVWEDATADVKAGRNHPFTVAVLAITGKIPADATQLIELTNNGNDPEPVWEDATADVKAGRNHPFTNKTQTNGWAFNFRVTVERGESGEDGNIVSIQGGFQ